VLLTAASVIGAVAIGGRIYGQRLAYPENLDRDRAMHQLETVTQNLERQSTQQAELAADLQARLTQVQEKLDTIMPGKDTYRINPNQSVVVGDGRLTLGVVGRPTADGVTINVNGKRYTVAAGAVIHVAVDASATCKVAVQSFDMFNATVTASCSEPKTH
jgi:hypothetical protein